MEVAFRCLGASRREWALAMRAEFDVAVADGRPFAFAGGCLVAAWREMPNHAEGRLVLSNYALALGVVIPLAVLQFGLALGISSAFAAGFSAGGAPGGAVLVGGSQNLLLAPSQLDAAPGLAGLWFLIGLGHLRLAWVLVERDWGRVANAGALIGAALTTLSLFTTALALDATFVVLQGAAIAIEFMTIVGAAGRHAGFSPEIA
jgi:hypothetical protein